MQNREIPSTNNTEINPTTGSENPWQRMAEKAPPFGGGEKYFSGNKLKNTEMRNLEEIHNCELDLIARNPDILGYNIDSKLIIWPERRTQATKVKEFLDSGGDITLLSEQLGQSAERIREAIDEELLKDRLLDDTLSRLPDGVSLRINPHAPQSAFSTANSEKIVNENGEIRYRINENVMSQVRKIREKTAESELLVVMSQLHNGEDGKLTSNRKRWSII